MKLFEQEECLVPMIRLHSLTPDLVGEKVCTWGYVTKKRFLGRIAFFTLDNQGASLAAVTMDRGCIERLKTVQNHSLAVVAGQIKPQPDRRSSGAPPQSCELEVHDIRLVSDSDAQSVCPPDPERHSGVHDGVAVRDTETFQDLRLFTALRRVLDDLDFVEIPAPPSLCMPDLQAVLCFLEGSRWRDGVGAPPFEMFSKTAAASGFTRFFFFFDEPHCPGRTLLHLGSVLPAEGELHGHVRRLLETIANHYGVESVLRSEPVLTFAEAKSLRVDQESIFWLPSSLAVDITEWVPCGAARLFDYRGDVRQVERELFDSKSLSWCGWGADGRSFGTGSCPWSEGMRRRLWRHFAQAGTQALVYLQSHWPGELDVLRYGSGRMVEKADTTAIWVTGLPRLQKWFRDRRWSPGAALTTRPVALPAAGETRWYQPGAREFVLLRERVIADISTFEHDRSVLSNLTRHLCSSEESAVAWQQVLTGTSSWPPLGTMTLSLAELKHATGHRAEGGPTPHEARRLRHGTAIAGAPSKRRQDAPPNNYLALLIEHMGKTESSLVRSTVHACTATQVSDAMLGLRASLQTIKPLLPRFALSAAHAKTLFEALSHIDPSLEQMPPEQLFQLTWSLLGATSMKQIAADVHLMKLVHEVLIDGHIVTETRQLQYLYPETIKNICTLVGWTSQQALESAWTPLLRSLLAKQPVQFSTLVASLCELRPTSSVVHCPCPLPADGLLLACDLGLASPAFFKVLLALRFDKQAATVFTDRIKSLGKLVFPNLELDAAQLAQTLKSACLNMGAPVADVLQSADAHMLEAEVIYHLYRPITLDFNSVLRLLLCSRDRCNDISRLGLTEYGPRWNPILQCYRYVITKSTDATDVLRFYLSKNRASMFAKSSAGICTGDNQALFENSEHLHLNIVHENRQLVVGNIQLYVLHRNGLRTIVVRGINPSNSYVNQSNAQDIVAAVLDIVDELARFNEVDAVYISEQNGLWNCNSNRPEIRAALDLLCCNLPVVSLHEPLQLYIYFGMEIVIERVYVFKKYLRSRRVVNSPLRLEAVAAGGEA